MTEPDLRISPALRNKVLGKFFLAVFLSILAGIAMRASTGSDQAKATALTLEAYTADYESYRAGLLATEQWPTWGWILLCFLFVGALILAYEAIGAAFAWMVGRAWAGVPAATDLNDPTDRTA